MHDIIIAYIFKSAPVTILIACVFLLLKERLDFKVIGVEFNAKLKNCIDRTSFDGIVHDTVYSHAKAA